MRGGVIFFVTASHVRRRLSHPRLLPERFRAGYEWEETGVGSHRQDSFHRRKPLITSDGAWVALRYPVFAYH